MNGSLVIKMLFSIVGGLGIFLLGMKNMSEGMVFFDNHRETGLTGQAKKAKTTALLEVFYFAKS